MKPLVSIIITNFNKQKYIKMYESCLNQNFRKFEICVIDNNSTDNSIEVLINLKTK